MRIFFLLFFYLFSLQAQTYEEFLRSQNEAFATYKEERDKAFSDYLNKEWKAYQESMGVRAYEKKKPVSLPKAKPVSLQEPEKKVIVLKQPIVEEVEKRYSKIIIEPESERLKRLYLNFYGVELTLNYDSSMELSVRRSVSREKIAQSWKTLASSEYKTTIDELKSIREKLRLNDWATYLLVKQVAGAIYHNENEARIFSWFVLLKMGYDARLSFQKNRVVLLMPVKGALFNTVYYRLGDRQYYAIDYYAKGKIGSIKTYEHTYDGSNRAIDFSVVSLPLLSEHKVKKSLGFTFKKNYRSFVLEYDKNLFDFYQSYPQVDYSHYFSAPESVLFDRSIKEAFDPLIVGKSQSEAVDIILAFVQNAFKYRVDTEQFDQEKVMFPSETLFYTYSDCEDRAILFSYMVKLLLGTEVIGLKYSNHMATALWLKEKVKGEYVLHNQKPYIVADPTYVNARLGMSMPQYRGKKAYEIILTGGEK